MTSLPYPLTDAKYKLFLSDSNKNKEIVINIKNYLTTLETYTKQFTEETSNVTKLSSYAQSIEQSTNLILNTIKECASSVDRNKCQSKICEFNNDIQNIIIDLIIHFSEITTSKTKERFKFLSFILTNNFAKLITDNEKNKFRDGKFYLCNAFEIKPPDPDGPLFGTYQELVEDAVILKENNDQQVLNDNIIKWLQYLAILIVVITICIIVYIKFFKKKTVVILNKIGGYFSKYN
jgi:hypothetical protein